MVIFSCWRMRRSKSVINVPVHIPVHAIARKIKASEPGEIASILSQNVSHITAFDKFTYSWLRGWLSMLSSLQFCVGFCNIYDVVALFLILYLCNHGDEEPLRAGQLHCEPRKSLQSSRWLAPDLKLCALTNDLWFPLNPVRFAESFLAKHIPTLKRMKQNVTQKSAQ